MNSEKQARILCVDDEPKNLKLLEADLIPWGYEVVKAQSGKDALKAVLSQKIDLILLDVMMPDIDGFEVCRRLRQDKETRLVPIVMITALGEREDKIRGIDAGCDDFLSKPFNRAELQARIGMLLKINYYRAQLDEKEKYETVIRAAMDGFWLIDKDGRILDVNDSYCNLTGYSREELLSMSVFDLRAEERPEDTKKHIQRIIESGRDRFESKHRCKDGRIVDLEVSVNYLDIDGGRFFAFLRDITERKLAEKEIAELTTLNQTLVKTIPFGMDVVDVEGNVLYLNPTLEALFGKEAIGKKCWELYRDDKMQCKDCPLKSTIAEGMTNTIETFGVLGGRSAQISHTGMEYLGKKVLLEIFQDITERKRFEEELIASNRELVKLDRLKSEFIATVSHELRTPIGVMREGVSQVVEGLHGEISAKQRQCLGKSLSHMERLTKIVNSILDIANLEAGKIGLRIELVDIAALAEEITRTFEPLAKNKNVEIRASFAGKKIELFGDKDKLSQVFFSLMDNAVKFTETGHIEIQVQETADSVECSVADTGKGISAEALPKAFDKFEQFGRVYGPGEKGVGLGLPIAKGIIELHKGKIWIESEPGKGTRVSFSLPKGK